MKISKLEDTLAGARVLDTANIDLSKVGVLTKVKLKNVTNCATMVYSLVAEKEADIANPNTETTAEHIAQDIKVEVSPKGLNVLQKVMNQNNDKPKS